MDSQSTLEKQPPTNPAPHRRSSRFSHILCASLGPAASLTYQFTISFLYLLSVDSAIPNNHLHGFIQLCPIFMTINLISICVSFWGPSMAISEVPTDDKRPWWKKGGFATADLLLVCQIIVLHLVMSISVENERRAA